MPRKNSDPGPYSSFRAIGGSGENETVHLRLKGQDATTDPEYANARLTSEPVANSDGEYRAEFFVPSLGYSEEFSEANFTAWHGREKL